MKIKYLLLTAIIVLIIFLIYLTTIDKKIYYLSLGDYLSVGITNNNETFGYSKYLKNKLKKENILETYLNDYSKEDYRITDLIKDIEDNKKIKVNNHTQTLKNSLVKADIVTLSIGNNDLINKINYIDNYEEMYDYIDEMILDLEKLLKIMRQYCKEDIFLIGYYNHTNTNNIKLNAVFEYLNAKTKDLCLEYKVIYIDVYKVFSKNKIYKGSDLYPSKEGYKFIYEQINSKINEKILEK